LSDQRGGRGRCFKTFQRASSKRRKGEKRKFLKKEKRGSQPFKNGGGPISANGGKRTFLGRAPIGPMAGVEQTGKGKESSIED